MSIKSLKGAWSFIYFQKFCFVSFEGLLLKRFQFKNFWLKRSICFDVLYEEILYTLQLPIYILCKLKIYDYHSQALIINIFQIEHFSALIFAKGYKKYELSCDTITSKSLGEKKDWNWALKLLGSNEKKKKKKN